MERHFKGSSFISYYNDKKDVCDTTEPVHEHVCIVKKEFLVSKYKCVKERSNLHAQWDLNATFAYQCIW